MSYVALYRKFRPSDFSQVKGQEHIVRTLKNQIANNRIGHAYLFTGTRGTGKTSVAKIFAKAVNCEQPQNGEPCNVCDTCRAISGNSFMNVIEIDAASNNSVDNIRQINEEVQYSPAEGKYKVYIIDEVHMLSAGAFNALLKTLEEPPSYVIFILATTEVHKLPITILSRCQRYDFRRISIETISERMKELIIQENIGSDDKSLKYIAKLADGSMRDALSLLDQCVAFYPGEDLTYENVLEVLGAVDTGVFREFLEKIIENDTLECIRQINKIMIKGKELGQFVNDFTWYLRNLLLVMTTSDNAEDVLEISKDNILSLRKEAEKTDIETVIRYIKIFSELSNQLKTATIKQVLIEIALIKITRPQVENDYSAILNRINNIEKIIEEGLPEQKKSSDIVKKEFTSQKEEQIQTKRPEEAAIPEELNWIANNTEKVFENLNGLNKAFLKNCKLSSDGGNILLIVTENEVSYNFMNDENNIDIIEKSIENQLGKRVEVQTRLLQPEENYNDTYFELTKRIKMNIIEEE